MLSAYADRAVWYPAGTEPGDLVVWVSHGFNIPPTPAGFTLAYSSADDPNGYQKAVFYKVYNGGSWFYAYSEGPTPGFDCTLLVFRGADAVHASVGWTYATGGSDGSLTSTATGVGVLIASDRGASAFPTIYGAERVFTGTASYFTHATGLFPDHVANTAKAYRDNSDSYGTSGLFFVVRPAATSRVKKKIPAALLADYAGPRIITSKQPWRQQPTGLVEVDWNNALSSGLVVAALPQGATVATPHGRAGIISVTESSRDLRKGTIAAGLWRVPGASTLDNKTYLSVWNVGASWYSNVEFLGMTSTGTSGNLQKFFNHNSDISYIDGTIPSAGTYTHQSVSYDGSIASPPWASGAVSGVYVGPFATSGTFPWNTGPRVLSAGESSIGIYATYLLGWGIAVSSTVLKEVARNPWQLFRARRRVLYFGSASAAPTSVEMAGLLESLLGSHTAGYIVTVNKGGELTGYVAHTAGAHVSVAVPASLTGSLLVSGGSQIAVSVPGTLTANASPSAGQYVTVQVTAESLSALSEILAGVSLGANITQSGVLTAANGQVSASFQVSVNQLNAVLTGLATLSGQHRISVAVGGALLSQAALSAAHYTSATVTGQVFSAQGQLLGSIEIGGVVSTAGLLAAGVGSLSGGSRVSVARAAGLQGGAGLVGGFAEGRVIADAVLTGNTALSGGFYTSVFVTGALTAYSSVTGELAHNVMIAADALLAQGLLQGSVRILGPAILTGVDPGVAAVTRELGLADASQQLGLTSLTPAYVVVSIAPHKTVTSH